MLVKIIKHRKIVRLFSHLQYLNFNSDLLPPAENAFKKTEQQKSNEVTSPSFTHGPVLTDAPQYLQRILGFAVLAPRDKFAPRLRSPASHWRIRGIWGPSRGRWEIMATIIIISFMHSANNLVLPSSLIEEGLAAPSAIRMLLGLHAEIGLHSSAFICLNPTNYTGGFSSFHGDK